MIKTKKVQKTVEEDEITSVQCDFCGKDFGELAKDFQCYGEITIDFGFGCSFDEAKFSLEICDSCFIKYFSDKLKLQLNKQGFGNKIIAGVKNGIQSNS